MEEVGGAVKKGEVGKGGRAGERKGGDQGKAKKQHRWRRKR